MLVEKCFTLVEEKLASRLLVVDVRMSALEAKVDRLLELYTRPTSGESSTRHLDETNDNRHQQPETAIPSTRKILSSVGEIETKHKKL